MTNVISKSDEIQAKVQEIADRNNAKVIEYNSLPAGMRGLLNTEVFDDIDYLLRYISALHDIITDLTNERTPTFEL